jgi:phosphatidylinositol alpha-1,6-mannosyltransferase
MRALVVTNDFPPRPGGIQAFVHNLATRLPAGAVVVYAPDWPGAAAFDAAAPFPVVRHPGSLMLPTPAVLRRARAVAKAEGCDVAWFGAAAPLATLARPLASGTGVERFVASTHGHEVGWAAMPGSRRALRHIGASVDVVTYLGEFTRSRLEPAFAGRRPRPDRPAFAHLPSGVDATVFRPGAGREEIRARHGLGERPVVVCVSRLVPRKGQDMLIAALPALRRRIPGTALLIVGGGSDQSRLARLARENDVEDHVVFTGSVPWEELPAHYAAGDVFAMPCRTRRAGLEVEGLGIVYLEASATGLPVVAGMSGGAPDAVLERQTGVVVDGRDLTGITVAIGDLLADPGLARRMGAAGRAWIELAWRWDVLGERLRRLLAGEPTDGPGVVDGVVDGVADGAVDGVADGAVDGMAVGAADAPSSGPAPDAQPPVPDACPGLAPDAPDPEPAPPARRDRRAWIQRVLR